MMKKRKSIQRAGLAERLGAHTLVQEADAMTESITEQAAKFSGLYAHLANSPDDRSRDSEIQYEINATQLVSKKLQAAYGQTFSMADELEARLKDSKKANSKRLFLRHPANSTIDSLEQRESYYAKGLSIYKLCMICVIGSFLGVVIELIWCLLTNGYLESRAGLVWGPFNFLYGAGAVALTVCLYPHRNRGAWLSFLGGMIVGSVVEYVCSWGQELVMGSVSWDYSNMPFNLNGRICLLYSVLWGALGVLWIKNIYPRIAKWLLKIPNKAGVILSCLLTIFLAANVLVSSIAVFRWSQRVHDQAPQGAFGAFIDERFPDERMERIYANMDFGEQGDK